MDVDVKAKDCWTKSPTDASWPHTTDDRRPARSRKEPCKYGSACRNIDKGCEYNHDAKGGGGRKGHDAKGGGSRRSHDAKGGGGRDSKTRGSREHRATGKGRGGSGKGRGGSERGGGGYDRSDTLVEGNRTPSSPLTCSPIRAHKFPHSALPLTVLVCRDGQDELRQLEAKLASRERSTGR